MNAGSHSASRPERATLTTGVQPAGTALAVTPHHLASEAALTVMGAGGSAVDAAIAADAVLGVVLPDTCGIGGDLFALVHVDGVQAPAALNASGRAGSGVSAADLRDAGHRRIPLRHPASVTVPGCVDGWEALQARYGRLPLAAVLEPAIRLAIDGFEVSEELAQSLAAIRPLIGAQPSAAPLYPGGAPPQAGDVIRRPRLAESLRNIGTAGRSAFYASEVSAAIIAATGGILTAADMEVVQADWVDPLSVDVFGMTGWTIPPNSQGYLALAAAVILEQLGPPRDPSDPAYVHACIEAYRSVAWERDDLVADPASSDRPASWLIDPERLAARAATLDDAAAATWERPLEAAGGTAYLCTTDGSGTTVSFIQSNFHGIGSGISAGDTGVFLHDRGAGFTLRPGHPNELTPGRRPLHTLSPTVWTVEGSSRLVLGTRGGSYQPQLILQVLASIALSGSGAAGAQAAPRWIVDGFQAGAGHRVSVEPDTDAGVVSGLRARNHDVVVVEGPQEGWGPVSLIALTPGGAAGFADPRVSTTAAGFQR